MIKVEIDTLSHTTSDLLQHCRSEDWAGYDPYDALNSPLFQYLPFLNTKSVRLLLTQTLKRSPINFRSLLLVPKSHNPKGLALFVSALVNLQNAGVLTTVEEIKDLSCRLLALRSADRIYSTWGYSFDWQTRTKLVPRGSPNIICTTFAANALLDAYEVTGEIASADAALSAADFILNCLYTKQGDEAWFNYTPLETTQIHNANLLGAALLARVSRTLGANRFLEPALVAARFSVGRQNQDGSWYYGERQNPSQKWIDSFHTGFNLCALQNVGYYGQSTEFENSLQRGLIYYLDCFFESDGAPRYFHNEAYPLDIHSAAQAIITLVKLAGSSERCLLQAHQVFHWTIKHLKSPDSYFYYQKHRYWTNRISYMRWGQSWMLLALSTLVHFYAKIAPAKLNAGEKTDLIFNAKN
jgi:hypothetical protein